VTRAPSTFTTFVVATELTFLFLNDDHDFFISQDDVSSALAPSGA
jgi:hypothetical protein